MRKQNTSTGVASASDATPSAPDAIATTSANGGGRRGGTRENRMSNKSNRKKKPRSGPGGCTPV